MNSKILICLDGSKLAEEVLPYVTGQCQAFQAEAILLKVLATRITIPPLQTMHIPSLAKYPGSAPAHVADIGKTGTLEPKAGPQLAQIEQAHADVSQYLNTIARPFREKGLKIRTLILEGEPAATIVNYANSNNISLIALTTHGEGGLRGEVMGRTAQFILKESKSPAMIIKPVSKQ
jgi:nucleotide-binding universal stress UspA family protein